MAMPLRVPSYTVDDLDTFLSDGNRYELLDGFLLVTPAPSFSHQLVAGRLAHMLTAYLDPRGKAVVVGPGVVELRPKTHLEPDILVLPAPLAREKEWKDFSRWWLAVEVLSRSSRVYDRDVKRDAYRALGVAEVWLVDRGEKQVLVSRPGEPADIPHTRRLIWSPPEMPQPLEVDLAAVFAGVE
jgi:Uma2 family endonuclease